jgi:spore coat protein U-like protein
VTVVAPRADAGTSTSAFEVTATVFASCTLSMGALALPSYVSGTATAVTGNANATVTCPGASAGRPVSVKIGIQAGAGAGPGSTLHPNIFEMDDGAGHVLTYSVKDDLGHAFAPNGTANPAFNETTNVADVHTFTATIPSLQGVPVGNYTQEDKATLTF